VLAAGKAAPGWGSSGLKQQKSVLHSQIILPLTSHEQLSTPAAGGVDPLCFMCCSTFNSRHQRFAQWVLSTTAAATAHHGCLQVLCTCAVDVLATQDGLLQHYVLPGACRA